jgi:hypothetical protein
VRTTLAAAPFFGFIDVLPTTMEDVRTSSLGLSGLMNFCGPRGRRT